LSFSVSNDNLVHCEVDVLDAQSEAFHGPESAAKQELRHEFLRIGHGVDDFHAFGAGQDGGQARRLFCPNGCDGAEFDVYDFPVEEEQRVEW